MTLQRWDPFGELRRMERELDRLWESLFRPRRLLRWREEFTVPLDVYETKDHVVVRADLPGVRPEDVEVTIAGNQLTLHGEMKEEREAEEEAYYLHERAMGAFSRTVTLPSGLDTDRAEATYDRGTMTIRIPKREEVKPKALKVRVGEAGGSVQQA